MSTRNVMINSPFNPCARGMTVVAWEATCEVWVYPIKNNVITTVEGSPPINPPTLLPNLSALSVVRVTHRLPARKLRLSLNQKEASIMEIDQDFIYSVLYAASIRGS